MHRMQRASLFTYERYNVIDFAYTQFYMASFAPDRTGLLYTSCSGTGALRCCGTATDYILAFIAFCKIEQFHT